MVMIIIAFSIVVRITAQINSFPKILGSNQGDTILNQIDVFSDYLAMAGHTLDNALTG